MKRIISVLMVIAVMCAFPCMAEESVSIEDQAKNLVSIVNYFVKENTGIEQLFIGYQDVVPNEIYGFYTEDNAIQALLVANVDENTIDSCSFICDAPAVMQLALNCLSVMPFAQLINGGDETILDAIQEDMIAMAGWLDENQPSAMEAFESGTVYGVSFLDSEYFQLDLMIVPLDEGARMMGTYYFRETGAEDAAE